MNFRLYTIKIMLFGLALFSSLSILKAERYHIENSSYVNSYLYKRKSNNDSLQKLSFKKLEEFFNDSVGDSVSSKLYAIAYLKKAKKNYDTLEIANAYNLLCRHNFLNPKIILKYVDSIIDITKNHDYQRYPTRGYLFKGYSLFYLKRFDEALDAYLNGLEFAKKKKDIENLIAFKHNIALLKNTLGKHDEALKVYRDNLYFIQKKGKNLKSYRAQLITTLFKLSETFNSIEKLDSANFYLKKGLEISSSGKPHRYYPAILLGYAINSFKKENYSTALDSLKKAERLLPKKEKEKVFTYLGKCLLKLRRKDEALVYLKKVDSLANDVSYYYPEMRDALKLLSEHYKSVNNTQEQLELLAKIIRLDSISNKKLSTLNTKIIKNYDTSQLVQEKDTLIRKIKEKNLITKYYFFGGLIVVTIFVFGWYKYQSKRKNLEYEKKYQEKIVDFQSNNSKDKKGSELELSEDITNDILQKLKHFEANHDFLKKDITLVKVAKRFKTNSTYLSRIINTEKQKSFANYLNDLRIDYCIDLLENDKKIRNYSIQAIAKEVGFNSVKSFSSAFYKKTGNQPSYYIKILNSRFL